MLRQRTLSLATRARHFYDITAQVQAVVAATDVTEGLCNLFIQHTSASLIICENADPAVRKDLETFMSGLVADGDRRFAHDQEGPDDMPAHIRSVLTQTSMSLPVQRGRCALGTWQGVYLWEHRTSAHTRRVIVTVHGVSDDD